MCFNTFQVIRKFLERERFAKFEEVTFFISSDFRITWNNTFQDPKGVDVHLKTIWDTSGGAPMNCEHLKKLPDAFLFSSYEAIFTLRDIQGVVCEPKTV